jgi:hypothetical protein
VRGVNCKSGKDRTALEISLALASAAERAGLLQHPDPSGLSSTPGGGGQVGGNDRAHTAASARLKGEMSGAHSLPVLGLTRENLVGALRAGLSYAITAENNGQPSAYAFSELELATLPRGWMPAWRLCGKVPT